MTYKPSKLSLTACMFGLLLFCFAAIPQPSAAAPKSKKAKVTRSIKKLGRMQKRVKSQVKRLSRSEIKSVSAVTAGSLSDSDADGLIDLIEEALSTLLCDADSDNDGLEDGDEIEDENDPLDGSDSTEVAGFLTLLSEDEIEIGDFVFLIDEDTEFKRDGEETEVSVEDFQLGQCVEIEATLEEDGVYVAHEVELSEDEEACEEEEENSCSEEDADEEGDDDSDSDDDEEDEEDDDTDSDEDDSEDDEEDEDEEEEDD